jgi:hypothetical protein
MDKTYVIIVLIIFLIGCVKTEHLENVKIQKLIDNELWSAKMIENFNGYLESQDYDFLRKYIPTCNDKVILYRVYYLIYKNIYLNKDNLENHDNIEILCLLAVQFDKEGCIGFWEYLEKNIFCIFPTGHFPEKAENVIIKQFQEKPNKMYAILLGKYYSLGDNGEKALHGKLNNSNKKLSQVIKLALARRGNKQLQKLKIKELATQLEKHLSIDEDKIIRGGSKEIDKIIRDLEYINTPESIYQICKSIACSKFGKGLNIYKGFYYDFGEYSLLKEFLSRYNIKIKNKTVNVKWWERNKNNIRKQLSKNVYLYNKAKQFPDEMWDNRN